MRKRNMTRIARALRRHATPAERRMWRLVRDRRMLGLKFKRQHVVRGFVVDFYCHELRLAIELDGGIHDGLDRRAYDGERSAILEGTGIRIPRLPNEDVSASRVKALLSPLLETPNASSPSPAARERGQG